MRGPDGEDHEGGREEEGVPYAGLMSVPEIVARMEVSCVDSDVWKMRYVTAAPKAGL